MNSANAKSLYLFFANIRLKKILYYQYQKAKKKIIKNIINNAQTNQKTIFSSLLRKNNI